MNAIRWNPFADLDELVGRLGTSSPASGWHPPADIRETDSAYVFDLEIPAVDPKDLAVSVRANVLSVSGERGASNGEIEGQIHRRERRFGKFTRSFRLPNDADDEAINATAKDGVVTITVSKRQQAQPRAIEVQSG
ncbi:MAG: Hsp20/alpha crystallin family protein [Gammaproteobacteria bacterium]|nr:Hsp20/alpha crystallin family protein [Gammaproteobacteria bacterium]